MKNLTIKIVVIVFINLLFFEASAQQKTKNDYVIVVHGGAGNIRKSEISEEKRKEYKQALSKALQKGSDILKMGGSAIDAVEAAIKTLEDSPLFNAGKGSVFTATGINELDASIMDGKDLNAGAVAGVNNIKNPISAARKVMENSKHVMLSGKGALEFAKTQKLEIVDSSYFYTQRSFDALKRVQAKEKIDKHGTVGCVVLDSYGNLAAGTSTGGMTNKKYGRIGDSPIIGAGTYANNNTCAVSCTGHGEYFIRYAVAHDVSALVEYKSYSIKRATKELLHKKLKKANGEGGIIAVDKNGNISMDFNTPGMFRGYLKSNGEEEILMF